MCAWLRDQLLVAYMRTPEHPMKYRIVRWLGKYATPKEGVLAKVHPGLVMRLHPQGWIEYLLLRGDHYEPMTLGFLAANLRLGDSAVLAGVNFGQHVAVAARAVGTGGKIIGVEPQPSALLQAANNLRLNGLERQVTLLSAALGPNDQLLPMAWSQPSNPGAASLLDKGEGFAVSVIPLSRVLANLCPQAPRLLLLDIQGFEAQALAGIGPVRQPEILIVEVDPEFTVRAGIPAADIFQLIRGLGYSLRDIHGAEVDSPAHDLPERNLVAVKPGVHVVWSPTATYSSSSLPLFK